MRKGKKRWKRRGQCLEEEEEALLQVAVEVERRKHEQQEKEVKEKEVEEPFQITPLGPTSRPERNQKEALDGFLLMKRIE